LKEEVAARAKQQAESLASNDKMNATIRKLRAKNYALHIKCGNLYNERVPLMKKCLEALQVNVSANHARQMVLDALKKTLEENNAAKNKMIADSRSLVDAMRVSFPCNEVEDRPVQRQPTRRPQRWRSLRNSVVLF
jgi:hypothetical protein